MISPYFMRRRRARRRVRRRALQARGQRAGGHLGQRRLLRQQRRAAAELVPASCCARTRSRSSVGEGKIGFFYEQMLWEDTDGTSDVAAVGFGDGQGNAEVLQGSTQPGLFQVLNNKYVWFDANLDVVDPNDVPEPTTLALALAALGAAGFSARRRKS
ncbi:MAG: PEP-CTERM sorting domain-containing protein [Comamonadaceae bacterium]|nr:PEP-CTERM sorting domain-containing protein [Comamonadaceae bacterium]